MTRRKTLVFLGLLVASVSLAQTPEPRDEVILIPKPGGSGPAPTPRPTPTPLPDPSGVYQGTARLQGQGQTFDQIWRVELKAQPCPDCDSGQYYIHSANYDGVAYVNGHTERGAVYGLINPSGTAVDLALNSINCWFLNPDDLRAPEPGSTLYAGDQRGGSFGDPGGRKLTVRSGVMSGHISGRDCFGQQIRADVNLAKQPGISPATCSLNAAGRYSGSYATSCGGTQSGALLIRQSSCYLSGIDSTRTVAFEGTVAGASSVNIRVKDSRCPGDVFNGTATVAPNGTVTGTYSGTSSGAPTCCPAGAVSGSFTGVPD